MRQESEEFKQAVQRLYDRSCPLISEESLPNPKTGGVVRFRHAYVAIDEAVINEQKEMGLPLHEFYEEAFKMLERAVKAGFGKNTVSVASFDDQNREWALTCIEELFNGLHRWRAKLKENPEMVVIVGVGYGGIESQLPDGSPGNELGMFPVAIAQLVDYTGEEGEVIDTVKWSLDKNGVWIDPEKFKQFGR